jgi:hypothetical protein
MNREEGKDMRGAGRENVVLSPRVVRAAALGRQWLAGKKKVYSPRAIRILTELLGAHVERLEGGGRELGRIEELIRKAESGGVDGAGLVGIMATIRNVFEPSSVFVVRRGSRVIERR